VPQAQLCVSATMIAETIHFIYQHVSCGNHSFRSTKENFWHSLASPDSFLINISTASRRE
jgi:hypothetical protein